MDSKMTKDEVKAIVRETIKEFMDEMYRDIGRSILKKIGWVLFALMVALLAWSAGFHK